MSLGTNLPKCLWWRTARINICYCSSCYRELLPSSDCCVINTQEGEGESECEWESVTVSSLLALQAELGSSEGLWKRCGWQDNTPDHISWRCNPENGAVWEGFPVCSGRIQMAGFQVAEIHCLQGESGKNAISWHCEGHLITNNGQTLYHHHICHILVWGEFHCPAAFKWRLSLPTWTSALIKYVLQRHLSVICVASQMRFAILDCWCVLWTIKLIFSYLKEYLKGPPFAWILWTLRI